MSDSMTIQLEGKSYAIEDFELGELEWLEDELGAPLDELKASSMKVAVRFVYLIKKRDNPGFTLDDARKLNLRVFDEPEEEKPATGKRPTRKAAA